nr:MAG TPA: hypothetical protein [Caudoviricetes sp.]
MKSFLTMIKKASKILLGLLSPLIDSSNCVSHSKGTNN